MRLCSGCWLRLGSGWEALGARLTPQRPASRRPGPSHYSLLTCCRESVCHRPEVLQAKKTCRRQWTCCLDGDAGAFCSEAGSTPQDSPEAGLPHTHTAARGPDFQAGRSGGAPRRLAVHCPLTRVMVTPGLAVSPGALTSTLQLKSRGSFILESGVSAAG